MRGRLLVGCAVMAALVGFGDMEQQARAADKPAIIGTIDPELAKTWQAKWEAAILKDAKHDKSADTEMGEELGWLMSPYLNGFYYGYMLTGDTKWIDLMVDWSDRWTKRSIKEPDGFIGWPKDKGASTGAVPDSYTDNILGEAMALQPMVLLSAAINKDPALKAKYGDKAKAYIALSEKMFEKWDTRGCWREIPTGGVWVVPTFGIDKAKNAFTPEYAKKGVDGFTLPDNKQNHVAEWMLAMYEATGKPIYKERAEKWWKVQKARMTLRDGKYYVWNYWEPAGPWDYKADKSTRHWVGVHPNGGYYTIDVGGIVTAYEHGLVFTKQDIDKLIATNRDFMWDKNVKGAKFQRIDGGEPAGQWKDSPGVLWSALAPYDETLRKIFEDSFKPDSWGGVGGTPAYLAKMKHKI